MYGFVNTWMAGVNEIGRAFCSHAVSMFIQSGVLIVALLLVDLVLRKRVRATLRYWIWMLVFLKLLLPPTLSLPTGIGYWIDGYVTPPASILPTETTHASAGASAYSEVAAGMGVPAAQTSHAEVAPATVEPVESIASAPHVARLTWQGGVFLLWGVGVLVFTAWMIQRVCFVRRLVARGHPAEGDLLDLLERCRWQMRIRRKVELKLSSGTFSPAVCGLRRPTILVPTVLLEKLSPDHLKSVLIHELAHVRRGDLWVNCLQTALQIIYFYNPLVWQVNAIVRRVREQAVDEMSLVALGAEAGSYGHALIDIAEMTFLRASPALRLVGVAESKKSLEGRIRHMTAGPIPKRANVGLRGFLVILAVAVVLLPMAKAERSSPSPAATSTVGGFAATLPDGVTVELIGLGTAPWKAEQQWWQPDGTRVDKPEFKTVQNQPPVEWEDMGYTPQFRCALLVKLSGHVGKDVSLPGLECSYNRLSVGMCGGLAQDGTQLMYLVSFPSEIPDTVDLFQAVCTGLFKEAKPVSKKLNGQAYEIYALDGGLSLIRQPLYVGPTKTLTVDLICPKGDFEYRVSAKLKNGLSDWWYSSYADWSERVFTATGRSEDLKVEDIEQLVIEYRPYQWVKFAGVSLVPGKKADVQVRIEPRQATTATADRFTTYLVNRWVAGFPPTEDRSTPEAAYATINRLLAAGDVAGLQRVTVAALAERLARESRQRPLSVDPEWAKVLTNTRTRQVIIYNSTRAVVLAELPQDVSARKIAQPIDARYLQLENGRWFNTGNNRFRTIDEAKAQFQASVEQTRDVS